MHGPLSHFCLFFLLFVQPIAGHIQKESTEIIAAEVDTFCVSFLYFCGPIVVSLKRQLMKDSSRRCRGWAGGKKTTGD